jgi:hypothetical protein
MDMMDEPEPRARVWKARFGGFLDRAEDAYLRLLRAFILVLATLLVLYAAFLAVISLYKIVQSPDSVTENVATVTPQEVAAARPSTNQALDTDAPRQPRINPAHRRAYDELLGRYHHLFQTRFEPFRQRGDAQMNRAQFDENFLNVRARLEAIGRGEVNFDADVQDLRSLVDVMTRTAELPETQQKLQRYKDARKVQVCRNVQRTRTNYRTVWNRYSLSCPNWYYDNGCEERRAVREPYTARECSMQFPEGTQSHAALFRAFQDEYFRLLTDRRSASAAEAQAARQAIADGNEQGRRDLWTALLIVGSFLVLMFFFLLIAIERHQRRLAEERSDL